MQSEAEFKKKLMKKLKEIDGLWCQSINQIAVSGTPDIIGCYRGKFFAIECKRDAGAKVTELQEYTLDRIRKAGGLAFVWNPGNWEAMFMDFFARVPSPRVKRGQIRVYRRGGTVMDWVQVWSIVLLTMMISAVLRSAKKVEGLVGLAVFTPIFLRVWKVL